MIGKQEQQLRVVFISFTFSLVNLSTFVCR